MPNPDDGLPDRSGASRRRLAVAWAWTRAHPYFLLFLAICLVMGVLVGRKKQATEFEWVYVLSATHLKGGREIYGLKIPPFQAFTYPPFMAVLAIPFVSMPRGVGRLAWYLVNVASLLIVWCGAWRLSGGGRLQGLGQRIDGREHLIAGLGLACSLPYLLAVLDHQQTDILIAALLIVGGLALASGRSIAAATCFGLTAGMKCTPLLWAPYLVWRGRWKAALWLVAVAVGVNLLPDLVSHPPSGGWWLVEWFEKYLKPMGRPDFLPGTWYAWILDNQSISGALNRWVTTACVRTAQGVAIVPRPHLLSAPTLRRLVYFVEGSLLLASWYALRRRGTTLAPARDAGRPDLRREAIEYSVILLLMLLFSPMSSRTHFGTMLLPALCLGRFAVSGERRMLRWLLPMAIAVGLTTAPIWGRSVALVSMWCGMVTWSALFLLAGCVWALLFECDRTACPHPPDRALVNSPTGIGPHRRARHDWVRFVARG